MAPFFETHDQSWVFLSMVYLGLGLGVVYDLFGLVRVAKKKGFTICADLVFFLLTGASLTLALIVTGQEGLRIYAFLGLACGGILYMMGLRRLMTGIKNFIQKQIILPARDALKKARERREQRKSAKAAGKIKKAENKYKNHSL